MVAMAAAAAAVVVVVVVVAVVLVAWWSLKTLCGQWVPRLARPPQRGISTRLLRQRL